jgi:hypothetical protein
VTNNSAPSYIRAGYERRALVAELLRLFRAQDA